MGSEASRRHEPLACVVLGAEADETEPCDGVDDGESQIDALVGQLLRRASRVSDAVGRIGSGEFAILAPSTGAAGATRLATRLGSALESAPAAGVRLRVRAGYCAVPDFARSPVDVLELLLRATTALRDLQREGDSERIRSFESPSVNLSN
jgi:predicted signal transduction protein with EAL and GGDEF domain